MEITINYWAVLVSAIASMILGALWYGPAFGKQWLALMGFTPEKMKEAKAKGMTQMYVIAFIGSLVMAYVLAHNVEIWGTIDMAGALQLAFWLWLGFIVTTQLSSVLWEGKSWKLYILNITYQLVSLSINALIITYWI